jgi:tetratricopeptide (TPR) repeat protein
MPEIYYYRGVTYRLMGRDAEAMADFLKSINLDQKYARSVTELADLYERKILDRKKALELVTEGLRHSPSSKVLQRRYEKLGGKLPYPEPYAQQPVQEPPVVQDKGSALPEQRPGQEKTLKQEAPASPMQPTISTEQPSMASSAEKPVNPEPQQTPLGMPSNPWCRFCAEPAPSKPEGESKAMP